MTGLPNLPLAPAGSPGLSASGRARLPEWFKVRPPAGEGVRAIRDALRERGLSTVCEEARCPNLAECWSGGIEAAHAGGPVGTATVPTTRAAGGPREHAGGPVGTATVMVMGDTCTRGCRFCSVATGRPQALDPDEPRKVSETVGIMQAGYVVITSVDRDDLPDGGAAHFAAVIARCKADHPDLLVEVLTPDFQGDEDALRKVLAAGPDVVAHNVETVRRLTPMVRDRRAGYEQSLDVLRAYKRLGARHTKTSLMLGLGETEEEIVETLRDLREADVDIVTFGQYLRPTREPRHLPVVEFVHPDVFARCAEVARGMGFLYVASGPLVRSSYRAGELFLEGLIRDRSP